MKTLVEVEPKAEEQFDPWTLTLVLTITIIEYEVFTFSKNTVAAAKQDAWLGVILGALIGMGFVYLNIKLATRFTGKSYFEYLRIVWGKLIGTGFSVGYLGFFMLFLTALFHETMSANRLLFLPKTPSLIPLLIFAVSLTWLIANGITPIVRFFQLMAPFLLLPLVMLAVLFVRSIELNNFLPVFGGGIVPIFKGAFYFLGAYQGPEVLLFIAPFITQIGKGTKPALLGYAIPAVFGWFNTVAAIGILGVDAIKESILPGIDVVGLIQLPGFPVERFGLLLTMPWLIGIYTTMAIYLYLLCHGVTDICHWRQRKITTYSLTFLAMLSGYFVPNQSWHDQLRNVITWLTPVFVYALPALTLVVAIIRKKGSVS